ncbi:MAG: DNA methyltransferase, partial [Leptolinea sp.]
MPFFYHNETLFSEIYLEEITRQSENADSLASLQVLREYRDFADTRTLNAWKESYVHEVLAALGFFAYSKDESLTYLFPLGNSATEPPLSLCYVVLLDEKLDNTTLGANWAEKIIRALREHNLQWGLLTNGRQWRIFHRDEPTPYETFLEIDLEAILKENARDAYQIFYKFMKAENFVVQEDGKCQFDRFKKESQNKIDYIEKELAKALKPREEGGKGVLSDLCMGYVEELRRQKECNLDDEGLRKKIYHGAMLYMFRLLFLFYADARQLLSDENHALLEKVENGCRTRHEGSAWGDSALPIWDSLEQIFVDIDQTYNGGLFSPQESEFTRFLSDMPIDDDYLVNVIFNLTSYREKNGMEKPISYRDMSVRHLGTLYEGLLEHKLFIATEDTEVKIAKGKIHFIPASQGGNRIVGHYIKVGEVYFAGDPQERKSTGSYYTPEYIVDYIVRNTVGEKLNGLKETYQKEQRTILDAYRVTADDDERTALTLLLEDTALDFVREKVLNLSVLDPAMGSGHFLVNTANLISNFITDLLNEEGITASLESGTGYWRRWVVENCIYGVDINPLAVELAKLSLWILSMAKDQPLSFMNHHLKCGNSLVGARLEEIGNYPFSTSKKEPLQLNL